MINNKPTLYISCGVPGSGKSTFLKKNKKENEIIVSRDDIRFSILKEGEEYFSHEDEVYDKYINMIVRNLEAGNNVYADATHLNERSRNKTYNAVRNSTNVEFTTEVIYFDVPVAICLKRNEQRKGTKTYVPRGIIRRMASTYTIPEVTENFKKIWKVDEEGKVSKCF